MEYALIPSTYFLKQIRIVSSKAANIIEEKLKLVKLNPYRFKRVKGYSLLLFRIRFKDERKEKRIVYLVDKPYVKLLCILDRDNDYKDLKKYLKKLGYL